MLQPTKRMARRGSNDRSSDASPAWVSSAMHPDAAPHTTAGGHAAGPGGGGGNDAAAAAAAAAPPLPGTEAAAAAAGSVEMQRMRPLRGSTVAATTQAPSRSESAMTFPSASRTVKGKRTATGRLLGAASSAAPVSDTSTANPCSAPHVAPGGRRAAASRCDRATDSAPTAPNA